jgi:hypothetical protein
MPSRRFSVPPPRECLDYRGIIMYRIDSTGRFDDICVAHNSFSFY